jgi:hypothetical protein
MQLYRLIYFSFVSSTCFGRWFCPSSGALDCIYSICIHSRRCRLVSQMSRNSMSLSAGCMDELELQFQLIHDTSRQRHWLTLPEAVNTVKCS